MSTKKRRRRKQRKNDFECDEKTSDEENDERNDDVENDKKRQRRKRRKNEDLEAMLPRYEEPTHRFKKTVRAFQGSNGLPQEKLSPSGQKLVCPRSQRPDLGGILAAPNISSSSLPCFADWVSTRFHRSRPHLPACRGKSRGRLEKCLGRSWQAWGRSQKLWAVHGGGGTVHPYVEQHKNDKEKEDVEIREKR